MITLITAVPGSGKTLSLISRIRDALVEGRQVFTNINELTIDKFPNNHNLHLAPDDWRDTPHGSLVIYDECQQPHLYPATAQRGAVLDDRLTAMETHRHTGHDLIFITQAPTFVHHHIRKLVGEHVHLYRSKGLQAAMRYEWAHTCEAPNDRREQERSDSIMWRFPKSDYGFYKSATVHTHKFKLPKFLTIFFVILAVGIVFWAYSFFNNFMLFDGNSINKDNEFTRGGASAQALPHAPLVATPYSWTDTDTAIPVAGCIANAALTKCQCYSDNGQLLKLTLGQCASVIQSPLPIRIKAKKAS